MKLCTVLNIPYICFSLCHILSVIHLWHFNSLLDIWEICFFATFWLWCYVAAIVPAPHVLTVQHFIKSDHLHVTFCSQILHAQTKRKVDVRHQAVTARVTWRACTPTIGACLAVRTKTGCHQKVSASVTHQTNTGLAYLPNLWPSCSLMFRNRHVSRDHCCVWLILCAVYLLCRGWAVFDISVGGSARGQTGCICTSLVTFCMGPWFCLVIASLVCLWWWSGKWGLDDAQIMAMQRLVGWSRAVNQWFTSLHETFSSTRLTDSDWEHIIPSTVVGFIIVLDIWVACFFAAWFIIACVTDKKRLNVVLLYFINFCSFLMSIES